MTQENFVIVTPGIIIKKHLGKIKFLINGKHGYVKMQGVNNQPINLVLLQKPWWTQDGDEINIYYEISNHEIKDLFTPEQSVYKCFCSL